MRKSEIDLYDPYGEKRGEEGPLDYLYVPWLVSHYGMLVVGFACLIIGVNTGHMLDPILRASFSLVMVVACIVHLRDLRKEDNRLSKIRKGFLCDEKPLDPHPRKRSER